MPKEITRLFSIPALQLKKPLFILFIWYMYVALNIWPFCHSISCKKFKWIETVLILSNDNAFLRFGYSNRLVEPHSVFLSDFWLYPLPPLVLRYLYIMELFFQSSFMKLATKKNHLILSLRLGLESSDKRGWLRLFRLRVHSQFFELLWI